MKNKTMLKFICCLLLLVTIQSCMTEDPNGTIYSSGLEDWGNDSEFGKWVSKSTRIVKVGTERYQPQLKDCEDEKAKWDSIFEVENFESLSEAKRKIRWAFMIQKGISDAFQSLGERNNTETKTKRK